MTAPDLSQIPHTPSKPVDRGAASSGSQRDRRWTDTFWDIHKHPAKFPNGRPFTGEREFKSGTSEPSESAGFITSDLQQGAYYCEDLRMGQSQQERIDTLTSAWSAPWLPLTKYFRYNNRQKRISFAYEKIEADENEALARFWEAAAKMAGENDVIEPDRPQAVPFRIKALLGSPMTYLGKIRLAQAARAGDPWLLGFVNEPNVELAKILGTKVNYIGGRSGDAQYTAHELPVAPKPVVTPEQVLATAPNELAKMIAEAVQLALAAQKAENVAKMAKARAARGKTKGAAA